MSNNKSAHSPLGWFFSFCRDEGGLATVEWMALAGAVVIGGVAVAWVVMNGLQPAGNAAGNRLTQCESSAPQNSGTPNCF